MRICVRFHMSGIFDSGWAGRVLETLKRHGEVEAVVTGTTGATALLDARLEGEVKSVRDRWSTWVTPSHGSSHGLPLFILVAPSPPLLGERFVEAFPRPGYSRFLLHP